MLPAALFALLSSAQGFSVQPRQNPPTRTAGDLPSRADFLKQAAGLIGGGAVLIPRECWADDEALVADAAPTTAPDTPSYSIVQCVRPKKGQPPNCVSTANVRQVDLYAAPWTFQGTGDEAVARIKGVIATDPTLKLVAEDSRYLRVKAERTTVLDTLEFIINDKDQVVFFRSAEDSDAPSLSDFGANKARLEAIRKKAGIFGVMGEGLTADSYEGDRGNGPLSQLKAFYGLQSGKGFEEVFEEN